MDQLSQTESKNQPVVEVKTSSISPDEVVTTKGLMELLKIKNKRTIYELIKEGMPTIRAGRNLRFIKNEVLDFLRKRTKMLESVSQDKKPGLKN